MTTRRHSTTTRPPAPPPAPSDRSGSSTSSGRDIHLKRDLDDEFDGDDGTFVGEGEEDQYAGGPLKKVQKRGAKACTACRKVKMRCIPNDGPDDAKCRRCTMGGYECIFLESQRGRHKTRTSDVMAAKLRQMQATLDTVLDTISAGPTTTLPPQFSIPGNSPPIATLSPDQLRLPPQQMSVNPLLLDAVSSELERYTPSPRHHDPSDPISVGPFGPLHLMSGTPDDDSAGQYNPAPRPARLHAGSFTGDPIKFPTRQLQAEPKAAPALLLEKMVTVEEIPILFDIFFDYCQPQAPFLDRELHTPTYTSLYAPFLFTCICTVASRYLPSRPTLYPQCRATAIRLAAENVFAGSTSISIVQGCLILAHWNQPGYPTEGDRTYLFAGMAVRMGLELGLNVKGEDIGREEEGEEVGKLLGKDRRNRERTWIHCVVTDRSLSLQMGKPSCVGQNDYLTRNAMAWSAHPLAIPSDISICAIGELHKSVATAVDAFYSDATSFSGLSHTIDYASVIRTFFAQTDHWLAVSINALRAAPPAPGLEYRIAMKHFYYNYYRVFLVSWGIQHAHDRPELERDLVYYVVSGYESAKKMVEIVRDEIAATGRLRYGMDSTFVYVTYCACFLLKLIHPTFHSLVDSSSALSLARTTAGLLEAAAVDSSHTPALYSFFLRALIESKLCGERTAAVTRAGSPAPPGGSKGDDVAWVELLASGGRQDQGEGKGFAGSLSGLPGVGTGAGVGALDALNENGFWENMLMPGFGGRFGTLSGGGAMLSNDNAFDGWGEPAMFSRAGSPQPFSDFIFSSDG